jgi:hypothetical protein
VNEETLGTLCQYFCSGTRYSLVVEDDGRVPYAYLLEGEDIIGDVWLYNRGEAPQLPERKKPGKMPIANLVGFAREEKVAPMRLESDIKVDGDVGSGEVRAAHVWLHGSLWAILKPGLKPGWSRIALKDGPLAKVLEEQ